MYSDLYCIGITCTSNKFAVLVASVVTLNIRNQMLHHAYGECWSLSTLGSYMATSVNDGITFEIHESKTFHYRFNSVRLDSRDHQSNGRQTQTDGQTTVTLLRMHRLSLCRRKSTDRVPGLIVIIVVDNDYNFLHNVQLLRWFTRAITREETLPCARRAKLIGVCCLKSTCTWTSSY